MALFYRYIGEAEKTFIETYHRIDNLSSGGTKFFSPDCFYSSGYTAQSYLALPCKPSYRMGPIDLQTKINNKKTIGLRRAYAAFGHPGGGWEITCKVPISFSGILQKIDTPAFCDHWIDNQYFKKVRKRIVEAIKSITEKLVNKELEWEPEIIKEGGFIQKIPILNNFPPFEFTISLLLNTTTNQLMVWLSAWWDYDENLCQRPQVKRFKYSTSLRNQQKRFFREWACIGPEILLPLPNYENDIKFERWKNRFNTKISSHLRRILDLKFCCVYPCRGHFPCGGVYGTVVSLPKLMIKDETDNEEVNPIITR